MKIGIYREFTHNSAGIGGAEYSIAVLAEALEGMHEVDVIHDIQGFTRERIAEVFGITLDRTRFRLEPSGPLIKPEVKYRSRFSPWKMHREASRQYSHLSEPYELFICFTHYLPPFCHASDGLLIVLFPFFDRSACWPWTVWEAGRRTRIIRAAKYLIRRWIWEWIWRDRFRSYRHRHANSEFTRLWTKRYWDVDCDVLYPPVDIRASPGEKQSVILSVGRITPAKRQLEMVRTFGAMARTGVNGWTYSCAGGLGNQPENSAYFDEIQRASESLPIRLIVNPSRADLESLLGLAGIFWHGMGYGEDEDRAPFLMEHFGISTVEAMAWGCVPVVINRGGQPEIVRHGVDGFLWETVEELEHFTRLLMGDEELRKRMADSARARAQTFSKQRFVHAVTELCGIPLNGR